jgi:hypothetical protein
MLQENTFYVYRHPEHVPYPDDEIDPCFFCNSTKCPPYCWEPLPEPQIDDDEIPF